MIGLLPDRLAAIDLGSSSFRLLIGRPDRGTIYPVEVLREQVQLGAGLNLDNALTPQAWQRALECLARFGEKIRGMPLQTVRAVATNTFRVASNIMELLPSAEVALGFPIEIISGREEGRLIYLGVAHHLPLSQASRLIIDIGGGSTEFIIGHKYTPRLVESLRLGSVSWSLQFFADGKITKKRLQEAEIAARSQIEEITKPFQNLGWTEVYGSSGTTRTLVDVLEKNGFSTGGATPDSLTKLREVMLRAGHIDQLKLTGLQPERAPLLAAGYAIVMAIINELGVVRLDSVGGALRSGLLYDLLGRVQERDVRIASVAGLARRYNVDRAQSQRVKALALLLFHQVEHTPTLEVLQQLTWAAELHEIGMAVSHHNYHKHSAYIFENGDLPGFSTREQSRVSYLALAQRGNLRKVSAVLADEALQKQILVLRLAIIFYHSRRETTLPELKLETEGLRCVLAIPKNWLEGHPMTNYLLQQEEISWREVGHFFRIKIISD